jgi:PAS domain S-box-containing protein
MINAGGIIVKTKICLIAPYDEIEILARQVIREMHADIKVLRCPIQEGVSLAKKLKVQGVQVIISRGGTAAAIRSQVDIPLVEIKITGYDVMRAIGPYRNSTETVGIIGFENVVRGCRVICDFWNIPTREFMINGAQSDIDWEDVRDSAQKLIDINKINLVIGDNVVKRLGLKTSSIQMISSGEESIVQAVLEAQNILAAQEEEKKHTERFRTILNSIHDGVVAVDETGLIDVINPVAKQIFKIKDEQLIGRPIKEILPNTRMDAVLKSGVEETGQLQQCPGGYILTNRIPILIDQVVKGVVATFQEVTRIQDDEQKIRQSLYAKGLIAKYRFSDIICNNDRMKRLIELAKEYSKTNATVLIQGENGTGKEMFAQSIHVNSARANGPFVAINCSAIPPQLLESELFGYAEGAFTDAKKGGKPGLFELAHRGTIFLDEIGDMNKELQTSLLRVLEERKVMRLGSDTMTPIDVRIIAATNVNLKKQIALGAFRMDLFYRLNVLNLPIPPLRERKDDISLLVARLTTELSRQYNWNHEAFPDAVIPFLLSHDWPGNIRELKNVLERIVLSMQAGQEPVSEVEMIMAEARSCEEPKAEKVFFSGTMHEIKRKAVAVVMQEVGYNKSKAAKILGINRATIENLL